MELNATLTALRGERQELEVAILCLEKLEHGRGTRAGRPHGHTIELKKRGRPPGSKNKPKLPLAV